MTGGLASQQIDLWLVRDDPQSTIDLACLSAEEQLRGNRYRVPEKKRQFDFSRSFGRGLLAQYWNVPAAEIDWSMTGRPVVSHPDAAASLSFSVSHSGDVLAIAVGPTGWRLGLDIEVASNRLNETALAAVACSDAERQRLLAVPNSQRAQALRQLWTIKEAVLKSLGQDQLPAPDAVEVDWNPQMEDCREALSTSDVTVRNGEQIIPSEQFSLGCFALDLYSNAIGEEAFQNFPPARGICGTVSVFRPDVVLDHSSNRSILRFTMGDESRKIRLLPGMFLQSAVLLTSNLDTIP